MSRLKLTSWERHCLRRQLATTSAVRLYRRTLAVLEFDGGRSVDDIAHMLDVTRQSVYNWIGSYRQEHDPAALNDDDRSGRPGFLGDGDEVVLRVLLAASPQELGFPHSCWTVPLLREVYDKQLGRQLSTDTFRRALWRMGYVWKRPRYMLLPDPEREKKKPHSTANPRPAQGQRRVGGGRDRPAALSASPRRVGLQRRGSRGLVERTQRQARRLRGDEFADG